MAATSYPQQNAAAGEAVLSAVPARVASVIAVNDSGTARYLWLVDAAAAIDANATPLLPPMLVAANGGTFAYAFSGDDARIAGRRVAVGFACGWSDSATVFTAQAACGRFAATLQAIP